MKKILIITIISGLVITGGIVAGICIGNSRKNNPQPTPTSQVNPTPTAETEPTPTSQVNPTPTAETEPTPTSQVNPTPTAKTEPTPTSQINPTPTAKTEPTPTSQVNPTPTAQPEHTHSYTEKVTTAEYLAKAATCTDKAEYYFSCKCGLHGTAKFEYGAPLGHSFVNYVYDNNATCSADGTKTAYCEHGCGTHDTINAPDTKLEHEMGEPVFTWEKTENGLVCIAEIHCKHEAEHNPAGIYMQVRYGQTDSKRTKVKPATCTEGAVLTYYAIFKKPGTGETDTELTALAPPFTETSGNPLGHNWGTPVYTWEKTENGYKCTAKRVCKYDGKHIETETGNVTSVTSGPITTYTATFVNTGFTAQTKVIEPAPLGDLKSAGFDPDGRFAEMTQTASVLGDGNLSIAYFFRLNNDYLAYYKAIVMSKIESKEIFAPDYPKREDYLSDGLFAEAEKEYLNDLFNNLPNSVLPAIRFSVTFDKNYFEIPNKEDVIKIINSATGEKIGTAKFELDFNNNKFLNFEFLKSVYNDTGVFGSCRIEWLLKTDLDYRRTFVVFWDETKKIVSGYVK